MPMRRRSFLGAGVAGTLGLWLAACSRDRLSEDGADVTPAQNMSLPDLSSVGERGLFMPAEEERHDATWMCFPGRSDVWGRDLDGVQAGIADIALAIARFEMVRMLVAPDDLQIAADLVGSDVELIAAPVDDLWARDTLPLFLVSEDGELAAGRVRFNGWGGKQVHDGDETLAAIVADVVGVELVDSGLVGEGGGLEVDGAGTVLAARSSWVNDNRNPGLDEGAIGVQLVALLGAQRLLWVDGIAGQDITDGHIDTLARFASPSDIVHEFPSYIEPGETWYDLATVTATELEQMRTGEGTPYRLHELRQPEITRRNDDEFLASYVNYYVCNGAVIVPEFGDSAADGRSAELISDLHPGREIVAIDIDPIAAGGGGIHCATQQQPSV